MAHRLVRRARRLNPIDDNEDENKNAAKTSGACLLSKIHFEATKK